MPASELVEWQIYEDLYGPLGPDRNDILASIIATTVANASRTKKSRKRYKLKDFIIDWGKRRAPRGDEDVSSRDPR